MKREPITLEELESSPFGQRLKDATFKSTTARDLVYGLTSVMPEFDQRRKGRVFRGIMLGIAEAFPEDRAIILDLFSYDFREQAMPKVNSGAIIHKGGKKHALLKGGRGIASNGSDGGEPCDGCPGTTSVTSDGTGAQNDFKVLVGAGKTGEGGEGIVEPKTPPVGNAKLKAAWKTPDDVFEAFEGSVPAMRAFAQTNEISINHLATKPETVAKLLFEALSADPAEGGGAGEGGEGKNEDEQ